MNLDLGVVFCRSILCILDLEALFCHEIQRILDLDILFCRRVLRILVPILPRDMSKLIKVSRDFFFLYFTPIF